MSADHWLIAYDIRDGKRLGKVAKAVSSYGWRIQKSVFESDADEMAMNELKRRLDGITAPEDFVLILSVCEKDWQKRTVYGNDEAYNPMNGTYMVL